MTFQGSLGNHTRASHPWIFSFSPCKSGTPMHCTTLRPLSSNYRVLGAQFFLQKNGDVFSVMVKRHAGGLWSCLFMFLSLAFWCWGHWFIYGPYIILWLFCLHVFFEKTSLGFWREQPQVHFFRCFHEMIYLASISPLPCWNSFFIPLEVAQHPNGTCLNSLSPCWDVQSSELFRSSLHHVQSSM